MKNKYWSYLLNSQNILTFESSDDLNILITGYCEMVIDDFFSSFLSEYDSIFISEFDPEQTPFDNEHKFIIKFNDVSKATKMLKIFANCKSI